VRTPAKSAGRHAVLSLAILSAAALILAGCTSTAASKPAAAKPLTLTMGALIPQTGSFASLAPAETAGIKLAADDIDQASLGITVKVDYADSGDATAATAKTSVKDLISKHVTAIVGPSSNDVTKLVIGEVTGAGIAMISPQNSAPEFSEYKDHGLYFRTSPSDDAEGTALGTLIAKDGAKSLGLIVLKDDYGTGMQKAITDSFEKAGGTVATQQTFAAADTDLSKQVAAVAKAKPDAVALVALGQTVSLVPALVAAGIPAKSLYFTDRNLLQYGTSMPVPLTGAKGMAAGPVLDSFFQKKLLDVDPTLTSYTYAPESYDAVVLLALAALSARSTDGAKMAGKLRAVSGGTGHGEKATDFASAAQIILAGDPVDYDGYSGGIAFDKNGDPSQAVIGTFRYGADNMFTRLK
jgi:branched-chain amino acid transport system substrate-binding protein